MFSFIQSSIIKAITTDKAAFRLHFMGFKQIREGKFFKPF